MASHSLSDDGWSQGLMRSMLASIVGAILFVDTAVVITWGGTSPHAHESPDYADVPTSPIPSLPEARPIGSAEGGRGYGTP